MCIELRGTGRPRLFSILAWRKLLELARGYGWEPADEGHPYLIDDPELDGDWATGTQLVGPADAAGLAVALAEALPHLPPYEVTVIRPRPLAGSSRLSTHAAATGAQMWSPDPASEPIEFFSGRLRQHLGAVIALGRAGPFTIRCGGRRVRQPVTQDIHVAG